MKVTNEQLEAVSPYIFVKNNDIKNERGISISFKDRMFLIDILEDMSPLQAILKAPQIGATVTMTNKILWVAKYLKKDIIYTLPTMSDVYEMVGGKINRIIAQNEVYKHWTKDHDTVEQKAIGDNIIYWRGTYTQKQAMMVSSQLNVHDEVDASKPDVIDQYETRLQAEPDGWRWYFSHPSIVGAGIDRYWQKSDQKEWFIYCDKCKEWQFIEWPDSIDQTRQCYQCKFCQAEITDDQRRNGEWRKKLPTAEFSGYHISQLMCPWIPASKIIKDFKEKEPQYFHNFVLALPYADAKSKVTLETIKNLLTHETERKGRILFGVDTGIKIRWTYGDMNGLIDMGECDTYEELQRICDRHKDWIMVIDQGGDIIGVRQFAEKNKGKVFLCFFQQDKKSMELVKWGEGEEYGRVMADRNRLIQLVVDEMNDKRIPLQGTLEKWWNMWLHWSHMYRIVDEDRMGNLVYVWERSDRNDYCFVAGTKIKTSLGDKNIEDIKEEESVYTRSGLKKVLKTGITNVNAQTYTATFSNGSKLEATGNHPIYTKNRGFVALDTICYCDIYETQTTTKNITLVSIQKNQQRKPVYNLFVEDAHEYYANDILVHNCLAMCYYRVAIERFAENESSFEGGTDNDEIDEAPVRGADGTMPMHKLTMPTVSTREDDWRFN